MTNLSITAADVVAVKIFKQFTGPSKEAFTRGQYVRLASDGFLELGNASSAGEVGYGGIALTDGPVGAAATILLDGLLDVGNALGGLAFAAAVYLSDTDGTLADSAGTVSTVVGKVVSAFGATTADKLLHVKTQ